MSSEQMVQRRNLFRSSFVLLVLLTVLGNSPDLASAERLGTKCGDNGAFFCYEKDPSSFTRCIEHELYLFHCPEGLHFNTLSQTCDWPVNADCGGHTAQGRKNIRANTVWQDAGKESWDKKDGNGQSASGAISVSGSGKPWWRPDNVDPKSWEDVDSLVEVPFDGSVSVSASVSGKKHSGSVVSSKQGVSAEEGGSGASKQSSAEKEGEVGEEWKPPSSPTEGSNGAWKQSSTEKKTEVGDEWKHASSPTEGSNGAWKQSSTEKKVEAGDEWKHASSSAEGSNGAWKQSSTEKKVETGDEWKHASSPTEGSNGAWKQSSTEKKVETGDEWKHASSSAEGSNGAWKENSAEKKVEAGDEWKHASSAAEGGNGNGKEEHSHSHEPVISDTADKRPDLANVQWHEGSCNPSECMLPSCRCPGTDIPGGLPAKSTPQMVMLTFDDEVSAAYYGYFQRLFRPGRYNPNGCPVRGCLFVSGSGTDYDLVYPLYAMGVEIASHTLSHKFPHTWWASASYQEYVDEVEGMRRKLSSEAGVPYENIKGFRVPFLQLGGDSMYKALYDQKFVYDTSMFTGSVWEGSDPVWPFTLDYTIPEVYCQHDPCPVKQYPGLWEIPVQRWYGVDGHSCAMPDGCTASADVDEDLEFFRSNFKRYYNSNRAPFGIFVHARWFHTEHHLEALDRFIDELMGLEDVYIVTPIQVIEWLKNPTPVEKIKFFHPWSCEGSISGEAKRR